MNQPLTEHFVRKPPKKTPIINPFNEKDTPQKFALFQQVAEAISYWVATSYPDYANTLDARINSMNALSKSLEEDAKVAILNAQGKIVKEVNNMIKKEYPELDANMIAQFNELKKQVTKKDSILQEIEKKLVEVVKSENIYKDVYLLKDEIKLLSSKLDKILMRNSKFTKKLSELWDEDETY